MGDIQVHGRAGKDVREVGAHDEEVEGGDASPHDEEEGVYGEVAEVHDEVVDDELHGEEEDDELCGEEEDELHDEEEGDVQETHDKVYA